MWFLEILMLESNPRFFRNHPYREGRNGPIFFPLGSKNSLQLQCNAERSSETIGEPEVKKKLRKRKKSWGFYPLGAGKPRVFEDDCETTRKEIRSFFPEMRFMVRRNDKRPASGELKMLGGDWGDLTKTIDLICCAVHSAVRCIAAIS